MEFIHSLISDLQLEYDLLRNIKNRVIEQKHFYTEEGAELFYKRSKVPRRYEGEGFLPSNYVSFFKKNILKKKKIPVTIISLACGNASPEKRPLEIIEKEGYHLTYVGVDASKSMLDLASENLAACKFRKRMICADFSSHIFLPEIKHLIGNPEKKIFAMFGRTFGNITPTDIIDTLRNIVTPEDFLWLDVAVREDLNEASDLKVFKDYAERLYQKDVMNFYFHPLQKVGVDWECGEMTLEMDREISIGALNFRFFFLFKAKTTISFRDEVITILPGEKIQLMNIRVYHIPTMIHFFKEHGFKCLEYETAGNVGQFLFQVSGSAN